ncbi:hypothetical protein C8F01DRAFT_1168820 [Mycena amicta]|nr:hypothetical protein C8F01DRAFT_1168820 [Mycena amicta]
MSATDLKRKRLSSPVPQPEPSTSTLVATTTRATFLGQVYDMLTPPGTKDPGSFSWRNDGKSIVIKKPAQFEQNLLPTVFPGQKEAKSLMRALQHYDFKHKTQKGGHIIIKHPTLTMKSSRAGFLAVSRKQPQRRITHATFLGHVYDMISPPTKLTRDVISWSKDGKNIVISDPVTLEEKVLPKCIPSQKQVYTFTRALHFYGFGRRTEYPSGHITLTHPILTQSSSRDDFLAVPHVHYNSTADECLTTGSPFDRKPLTGPTTHSLEPKQAPSKVFLARVHDMLASSDERKGDIIAWSDDGQSIVIAEPARFLKELLPVFFPRQTQMKSFTRSLREYGFVRKDDGAAGSEMVLAHPTLTQKSTRAEFHAIPRRAGASSVSASSCARTRTRTSNRVRRNHDHDSAGEDEEDSSELGAESESDVPVQKKRRKNTGTARVRLIHSATTSSSTRASSVSESLSEESYTWPPVRPQAFSDTSSGSLSPWPRIGESALEEDVDFGAVRDDDDEGMEPEPEDEEPMPLGLRTVQFLTGTAV